MKKYFGLLFLILLLNGCDDGDVKVEAINFDNVAANSCGNIVYKVQGNEALFLQVPVEEAFKNELTAVGAPRVYTIGGDVVVRYRGYNGTVTSANLCPNVIQPIAPVATIEWTATAGTIEITTTAVMSAPDATTGATRLTGYNHNIVFKNIVFAKPSGQQIYNTFSFGDYTTAVTALPLAFVKENTHRCPSGTIYNAADGGNYGMVILNLDPALLSTATETLNTPKPGVISFSNNIVDYRLLATAVLPLGSNDSYYCNYPFPDTPVTSEEWVAESGIIEVTTTTGTSSGFVHTIRLKGVTFRKGDATFYYGNDILFGELNTN